MVEKNSPPKKGNLRVVKWLSSTPVVAVRTLCNREFKVPTSALSRTADVQANLRQQLDRHACQLDDASQVTMRPFSRRRISVDSSRVPPATFWRRL
jgi:hypothetical protein